MTSTQPRASASATASPKHHPPVLAILPRGGQTRRGTQPPPAATGTEPRPGTIDNADPKAQPSVVVINSGDSHTSTDTQRSSAVPGPFLRSPFLRLAADVVDDLENVRNANQNRLRQLTRVGPDKDGMNRGFGLPKDDPNVRRLSGLVDDLSESYDQAVKNLEYVMRAHPLWEWAKPISGIGAKQFARLLGALGDPYWHDGEDRPRGLYELYSYVGLAPENGVGRRRRRGEVANWNDTAKMRAYLIAESCMQQIPQPERNRAGSPYRAVYDAAREKYVGAVHTVEPCPQCGVKGKPAPVGSALRDGHIHRRALRAVAKQFLKDLWRESERLHKEAAPLWN